MEEILRIARSIGVMLITTSLFCWLLISELDFNLILAFVSFAIGLLLNQHFGHGFNGIGSGIGNAEKHQMAARSVLFSDI